LIECSGSCLENREYGRRDPSRWPRGTLYPQKLAITSPTSSGRSAGIGRSRTQTMEFSLVFRKETSMFPSEMSLLGQSLSAPVHRAHIAVNLRYGCSCNHTDQIFRRLGSVLSNGIKRQFVSNSCNSPTFFCLYLCRLR
jgi:hypothetical protein